MDMEVECRGQIPWKEKEEEIGGEVGIFQQQKLTYILTSNNIYLYKSK